MKKKLLTVLASIGLSLSMFAGNAFAAGIGLTSTTYGTYYADVFYPSQDGFSFAYSLFGINIPITTGSGFTLVYDFKGNYSGDITVGVTGSTTWILKGCHISVEGGYIKSFPTNITTATTTKTFTIHVDHSTGFTFTIVSDSVNTFANSSVTLAFSYNNMVSEASLEADVDDIRNKIDLYLPGMSTSLSNIDTDLDNINQNIQALSPYIDQLEGYVDGLEGLLSSINSLLTYNVPEYKYLAYYQFSRFSYLDTEFHRGGGGYLYNMGPFVKVNSVPTTYVGEYSLACNYANRDLYVIYYSFYWLPAFDLIDSDGNSVTWTESYKVSSNDGYMLYYQHYHYSDNNRINLNIIPVSGINGGNLFPVFIGYHIPSEVADMYGFQIDNTYTELLNSLISAVGSISLNQTIVNQNNTNITNNDTYQTQIHNVTNNYYTDYNTYNTSIENDNVFDFSGVSSDGVSTYHGLFATIWGFDLVRWPILIILLGFILLVVLG